MREQTSVRIYVGNLSYQTTNEELTDLFAQVGQVVSATVITDRDSGQSKGFGFVEMSDDQEAQQAISRFNGYALGNRTIVVNEARERQERPRGGGGGTGGGGGFQNRDRRGGGGGGSDRRGGGGGDRGGYSDRRY